MKRRIILPTIILGMAVSMSVINVYAGVEIPGYSVDLTYQLDFFSKKGIRDGEYIITDAGRFNNQYDVVNFKYLYDGKYKLEELKEQGYMTMGFELTFTAAEIYDGYQYIYFYDDTSKTTYLTGARFEHGSGKKKTEELEYIFYCEIPLANIKNEDFVIRYDASGKNDDDWIIKNVSIQVGFSKELMKTSNIWHMKWTNNAHTTYSCTKLKVAQ